MLLISLFINILKTSSIVLLISMSRIYLAIYLSAEMGIYLLIKAGQRNFIYWIPMETGWKAFFVSLVIRVAGKIITDFTSILHMRHVR